MSGDFGGPTGAAAVITADEVWQWPASGEAANSIAAALVVDGAN